MTTLSSLSNLINETAQNLSQFKGLTAAYSLLGGVPTIIGYRSLIHTNNIINFGAAPTFRFSDETIYINTVNALYQGNSTAKANFDKIVSDGDTLAEKLSLVYDHIVAEDARTEAGKAWFSEQAEFYTNKAAELGIQGENGAAVVAFASLMKIAVDQDVAGMGATINTLIHAVEDGQADLPRRGDAYTPLDEAIGEIELTSSDDEKDGTNANDIFDAPLQQVSAGTGGLANTLATGDEIDGLGGYDLLHAVVTNDFVGNALGRTDIQPTIIDVEEIQIQVNDNDGLKDSTNTTTRTTTETNTTILEADFQTVTGLQSGTSRTTSDSTSTSSYSNRVTLDAKDISGHEKIGSYYSDGDLVIENLTTLKDGEKRPTADITITMDHTDNRNSDGDASDLTVYFDDNYLIAGKTTNTEPALFYFLDQAAELERIELGLNTPRLNEIDVTGISFHLNGGPENGGKEIKLSNAGATNGFFTSKGAKYGDLVNALNKALDEHPEVIKLRAAGQDLKFELDDVNNNKHPLKIVDVKVQEIQSAGDAPSPAIQSLPVPSIFLDASEDIVITKTTIIRAGESEGYNVYADSPNKKPETTDDPISANIDLEKVGRGHEGGGLLVGAKSDARGIEVFHVNVKGGDDKPSNLQFLDTTADALRVINIKSHADDDDADDKSFADLTIRQGPQSNLETINADKFFGNLNLGSDSPFLNVDTITAKGGGDVTVDHVIFDPGKNYSIMTADGKDTISQTLQFDAGGFGKTTVRIETGKGNDRITLDFETSPQNAAIDSLNGKGTVTVDAGAGNDRISLHNSLNETVVLTGDNFGQDRVRGFETGKDAGEGFDFLDFTYYLTSREDPAGNAPEAPIGVTLDFNEDHTLRDSVAANEVAVVRMTDNAGQNETFAALSEENIAMLFKTDGGTAFGGDNSYGNLTNTNFSSADYIGDALVGKAKAVLLVDNAADVGNYKVFELTWSGRAGSDEVNVAELGRLDFGNSGLAGLVEENIVGTSQYDGIA